MKQAIALDLGEYRVPLDVENKRCLFELTKITGIPLIDGFVGNEVELITLDRAIAILNGEEEAPEISFSTEEPTPTEEPEPKTALEPIERPRSEEFEGTTDDTRAQTIRDRIRARLLHNTHDLPGCRSYEVRLGAIFENWGTGLSRGSISRHLKRVVEALQDAGHDIYCGAGRYRRMVE